MPVLCAVNLQFGLLEPVAGVPLSVPGPGPPSAPDDEPPSPPLDPLDPLEPLVPESPDDEPPPVSEDSSLEQATSASVNSVVSVASLIL
jgi:hypothetical protein